MKSFYRRIMRDSYSSHDLVPWWKGLVRRDFLRDRVIVAPIPFNVIFSLIYNTWLWVSIIGKDTQEFLEKQIKLRD